MANIFVEEFLILESYRYKKKAKVLNISVEKKQCILKIWNDHETLETLKSK